MIYTSHEALTPLPVGIYVIAFFFILWIIVRIDEIRQDAKEKRLGYRISFLASGMLRAGEDDWALTYREHGKEFFFYRQYVKEKKRWAKTLDVPSAENWDTTVPEWMQGRRDEILSRVKMEAAKYHFVIHER